MSGASPFAVATAAFVFAFAAVPAVSSSSVQQDAPPPPPGNWSGIGKLDNQGVHVDAELATRGGGTYETGGGSDGLATEKYFRAAQTTCAVFDGLDDPTSDLSGRCAEWERQLTENLDCDENSYYLGALYRQIRQIDTDGTPGEWSAAGDPVADQSCVTPADLAAEAAHALATLTLTPSPVVVQPPDGWTLVNVATITYTEPAEQTLDTTDPLQVYEARSRLVTDDLPG